MGRGAVWRGIRVADLYCLSYIAKDAEYTRF
jgi:hypothetical protein